MGAEEQPDPTDDWWEEREARQKFNDYCHKRRCVMCGKGKPEVRMTSHHVISQQRLRMEGLLAEHKWDVRNAMPLCWPCHQLHELWSARVPYEKLRPENFAFAKELTRPNGQDLSVFLELNYPRVNGDQ